MNIDQAVINEEHPSLESWLGEFEYNREIIMSKRIMDEMVHEKFCYFNKANRAYIPYTLEQLTLAHCQLRNENVSLLKQLEDKKATIEGLQRDIKGFKTRLGITNPLED